MGMDDICEHGASGFCMSCCREGEGKGTSAPRASQERAHGGFCAYGRDPAVSQSRECCYRTAERGGFCPDHGHLAGTKEDVYLRGAADAAPLAIHPRRAP